MDEERLDSRLDNFEERLEGMEIRLTRAVQEMERRIGDEEFDRRGEAASLENRVTSLEGGY